jgi:hypothetical protein
MNKKSLTETDIRTKFITPAIMGAEGEKWNLMTQIATVGAPSSSMSFVAQAIQDIARRALTVSWVAPAILRFSVRITRGRIK